MKNKEIENYYQALKNMYVDEISQKDKFKLVRSNVIDDGIWNFACDINGTTFEEFQSIFEKTKKYFFDRTPRFYVLEREIAPNVLTQLKEKYNIYCEDSWFAGNVDDIIIKPNCELALDIKICENKNDVVETIMNGFSTNDPNDPYGDLSPTYKQALEMNFGKTQNGYKTYHYVAYLNGRAVSIISATIKSTIAYLNNFTTLKEFKGRGIGKALLAYVIEDLKSQGVDNMIFATERGAYTEEFYKKLGFEIFEYGYCFE